MERISLDREDLRAFQENTKGFVYVLEHADGECRYFAAPDLAYAHGLKYDCAFSIKKYKINEPDDLPAAGLCFTRNGILESFWSDEVESSLKGTTEKMFHPDRFENAFIPVPNPFERGDIVKLLSDGGHGVVSTSSEEWRDFLEKVNAGEHSGCDFIDASITVEFIDEGICHDHVNPAYLERYEPGTGEADYELLMAASELLKGRGGLDWFVDRYEAYKEKW